MHVIVPPIRKIVYVLTVVFIPLVFAVGVYGSEISWTFHISDGYVDTSPALGDITGDGMNDIILGTTKGNVIALDAEGRQIWLWDIKQPISIPPTVADVTGDLAPEVLVLSNLGRLWCLDGGTGNAVWTFDLSGKVNWGTTSIVATDINADGNMEIIAADSEKLLVCLNGDGEILWSYETTGGWSSSPAVGDLDGDGFCEILIGSARYPLVCFSHKGKKLWHLDYQKESAASPASPVVWDLDNDGKAEILTGIGNNLVAVSADGKVLWRYKMRKNIDSAVSVADADGDGHVKVYAVDLAGLLVCVSDAGKLRWSADVKERVRRSPAVADVDGDGDIEILVAGYNATLYVFDAKGELEEHIPLKGNVNATLTVVDSNRKGRIEVICPVNMGERSGEIVSFQWNTDQSASPVVLWPEYRYNSQRTAAGPGLESAKPPVMLTEVDCGDCYIGTNTYTVRINNANRKTLDVSLSVSMNKKTLSANIFSSADETFLCRLPYTLSGHKTGDLKFDCTVTENGDVMLNRKCCICVVPFMKELAKLDEALSQLTEILPLLPDTSGLKERIYFLQSKMPVYRERVLLAGAASSRQRRALRDELAKACIDCARWLAITNSAMSTQNNTGLLLCAANPWAPFGGIDEIIEGRFSPPDLAVETFQGEVESAALNVFNFNGRPMTFRVELGPLVRTNAKTRVPAKQVIAVREVVNVCTSNLELSADALPLLNQGHTIVVPAWGARQLWFSIDTSHLASGRWMSQVHLRTLGVDTHEVKVPITVEVWNAKLPEEQALKLCHWGYVHRSVLQDQPEAALEDQVAHGTNVFVGLFYPRVSFDEKGNLVGAIDFKAHDEYVRRHAPHGIILFCGYGGAPKGPAKHFSSVWKKAHIAWLREWVKHLAQMGVGYEDFALYPVDEPGLREGLVDLYINYAKLAREADPNILMYTDPVAGATLDDHKRMAPYVDIWCPNRGTHIIGRDKEKLAFLKSTGKTLWTYECRPGAKHQSPLGYYRGQAWLAWDSGLTGIGFWSYCTSKDDPWYRAKAEYLLIYQGDGVVPSKRWEAIRDGIEDFNMLLALKQAADSAAAADRETEAVETARRILSKDASVIATFCTDDGTGTLPGPEGLPGVRIVADKRWKTIQSTRRKMAELLVQLTVPKP